MRWMPLMLPLLTGCVAAVKGTYHMAQAEQAYALAQQAEVEEHATYAWTMAESYMLKAREEYGLANYQTAERLAAEATTWADKARALAEARGNVHEAEEIVPENIQRTETIDPLFDNSEEDVEFDPGEGEE